MVLSIFNCLLSVLFKLFLPSLWCRCLLRFTCLLETDSSHTTPLTLQVTNFSRACQSFLIFTHFLTYAIIERHIMQKTKLSTSFKLSYFNKLKTIRLPISAFKNWCISHSGSMLSLGGNPHKCADALLAVNITKLSVLFAKVNWCSPGFCSFQ